jgi:hypothetical protein
MGWQSTEQHCFVVGIPGVIGSHITGPENKKRINP